ncbi:MAG: prepilin-type N-terminal cleavage/methylation domain-containing protein [Deltaproteobacteria bacterium]|nr:prepilin-type N-terminal cleavage/methylation domain-containing protein [Deltaproteobacteria bacterium]
MRDRSRGFSLPELLVATALAGILLALSYQILVAFQRNYLLGDDLAEARQNGRIAFEELGRVLSSAGAGVDLDRGQMRILSAHPYQIVFNADLRSDRSALAPGTTRVPGAQAQDPWDFIPGTYTASSAETYRYTLDRTGDGRVTPADRASGDHYTLYRETNGGTNEELAQLLANPRLGRPLFRYEGDFDGDGSSEMLERVDRSTSSRVAAGASLDSVIRRIEVEVITETADPDLRWPHDGGYRQVCLEGRLALRNLP